MPLPHWSRALLAALALAGCKSNPPSSTADAGTAAVSAGSKAPATSPAPMRALWYLRPVASERCEWVWQPLPSGELAVLFSFDAACDKAMVSWSPKGQEGLVFAWPSAKGTVPKAWRVDFAASSGKPIDLKPLPGASAEDLFEDLFIQELGFDRQGRPLALISHTFRSLTPREGLEGPESLSFEGKSYPLPLAEGIAGLAHAYRLEAGGWKRIETQGSRYWTDIAPGVQVLEAAREMGPVAKASPEMPSPGELPSDSAVQRLDAMFPGQDESGAWRVLATPGGNLYYRATVGAEFLHPSAPMRWEEDGQWVELEGLAAKEGEFLYMRLEEELLLLANDAAPRFVQLWDTRTKKLLVSAEGASAPALRPPPRKP